MSIILLGSIFCSDAYHEKYPRRQYNTSNVREEKIIPSNRIARIAGFLYLFIAITAGFAEAFRSQIIVSGNATATVENIMTHELLFRISMVSDLIAQTAQIVLVLVLYLLLKSINKSIALLMVFFVIVFVPMVCINMVTQFAPLLLVSGADYLKAFSSSQLHALVMLFLDLHKYGYLIVDIFFGLWLLPLGFLVFKSGYFPKILGILLMIGCTGYLITFLQAFLFPGYEVVTYPGLAITTIAESAFLLWLLIKGVTIQKQTKLSV